MTSKTTEPQVALARMVSLAAEGTMQILDARIVPGTSDQVPAAGAVATHFATTAHTFEQGAGKNAKALGKVVGMRFRFLLDLPALFVPARGLIVDSVVCQTR